MPPSSPTSMRRLPSSSPPAGQDLLTPLPDEMVDAILSRLPTRDAVRTSVLAGPWRHRWANCPSLEFEFLHDESPAIEAILARYECPFQEIRIMVAEQCFDRADDWLRLLADKRVRSLTLCLLLYPIDGPALTRPPHVPLLLRRAHLPTAPGLRHPTTARGLQGLSQSDPPLLLRCHFPDSRGDNTGGADR